jgi:hypothetical protein
LTFTGDFGRRTIDVMYPPLKTAGVSVCPAEFWCQPVMQTLVYRAAPQAIQALDIAALVGLAERLDGVLLKSSLPPGSDSIHELPFSNYFAGTIDP